MLSVTSLAKEKLKEALNTEKKEENTFIRIAPSSTASGGIGFILDREKHGDEIIEDDSGQKLILLGADMAPLLNGMLLDYKDTDKMGMQFTITQV